MASLQGTKIKDTYKSLLKVADNGEIEVTDQEITDGLGQGTGVSLNTQGDVIATGTVSFDSLKDTDENITISKFVDEADGIAANDNDTSIPTSAAVKDYVDSNVTAQDLDITDGTNNGSVDLDSQSLTFTGDAGVSATVSGQTLTLDSSALQSQITSNDSDITALQAADTTLQSNIDAEETARIAADAVLQANINLETANRTTADTTLQNNINAEASTRASADTTLQGNIDTEEAARIAADTDLANDISTEASTRASADTALQGQITSNDGDISGLDTRLTAAESNITSNDSDISALDGRLTTAEAGIFVNDQDITNLNTRLTAAEGNITSNDTDISALQSGKQDISEKNQANGYAPLDGGAKVPIANLPDSVVGQVEYQGTWNASTDTPTLPSASTVKGHYYVVSAGGTYETITYAIGDWIISNGTAWEKVDNTDAVTTVFGRLGAIVANESDYSAYYPLISDLNTTNSNVSGLDTRLTTAEGDITAIETKTDNITVTQPVNLDTIESDLATAKSDITAIETKTDNITVTQAVNLDTMESDIATNASNIASNDTDISNLQSDKYDKTGGTITGNVTVTGDLSATNIAGTLSTAAQTNITSVGTLSSLAVSGNLTVDTDTLFVDAASNLVGIGTSSPAYKTSIYSEGNYDSVQNLLNISAKDTSGGTYNAGTGAGLSFSSAHWSVSNTEKVMGAIYGANTSSNSGANGYLTFHTRSSDSLAERMRIDSSGNVGIGTFSPTAFANSTVLAINNASQGGILELQSNGTSALRLACSASDSALWEPRNNDVLFGTNNTERMRILSSGGLTFNGDTAAANALDDYEEGTWTPAIGFSGGTTGITYTTQEGKYTKIGRQVTVTGRVTLSSKGSSTGSAFISGLPIVVPNVTANQAGAAIWFRRVTFANQLVATVVGQNTQNIGLYEVTEAGVLSDITNSDFANDSDFVIQATYFVS